MKDLCQYGNRPEDEVKQILTAIVFLELPDHAPNQPLPIHRRFDDASQNDPGGL